MKDQQRLMGGGAHSILGTLSPSDPDEKNKLVLLYRNIWGHAWRRRWGQEDLRRGSAAHHLGDGQGEGSEALQVDLQSAAGHRDDVAAQEHSLDALAVLAIAHAAEGVILAAQVHAHGVHQLILGPPNVLGPAAKPNSFSQTAQ